MVLKSKLRYLGAVALIGGTPLLGSAKSMSTVPTLAVTTPAAEPQINPFENGSAGFVVSDIAWALGPDADKSGACPNGMTMTARDAIQTKPERRAGNERTDLDYDRRASASAPSRNTPNACQSPEAFGPDPLYRTVSGPNIRTYGIDLDGRVSRRTRGDASGTCAHDDFQGMNGERGVDNQFYRLVGCTKGFQSTGSHIPFATEMLTGAWGILISIKGVDNPMNDDEVEVGIYANADPIKLSPARKPLLYATYSIDPDPRFRATTRGRIVNGVLTTDPVNVRFHSVVNNMWLERPMDDARLRMNIMKDGSLDGILAGYTEVDELFDYLVGLRSAKDANGNPAPGRFHSSLGSARSAGLTCNGIYHAMKQLADGHRDPKTGQCGAISTQYRLKAVRTFVVDNRGSGQNLAGKPN